LSAPPAPVKFILCQLSGIFTHYFPQIWIIFKGYQPISKSFRIKKQVYGSRIPLVYKANIKNALPLYQGLKEQLHMPLFLYPLSFIPIFFSHLPLWK